MTMRRFRRLSRPDNARARETWRGPPTNYLSFGTVGHVDSTPAYARIEGDAVLVEVTLAPSGDEVIARLPSEAPGFYMPLSYGMRVVVGMPSGNGSEPVIIARCPDGAWPWPDTVAGVAARGTGPVPGAPMFAFLRTEDGQLLAIETGDGGDMLLHSGGSIELKVGGGEQVLVSGRTHLGAGFSSAPTGPTVGPDGQVIPGEEGGAFSPTPYVPAPASPIPLPPLAGAYADGIVRAKDAVQSDALTDPDFWTWVNAVHVAAGLPTDPPLAITSQHKAASKHTASDG